MNVAIIVTRIDQTGPVMVVRNLINSLLVFNELNIKVFYIDKKVDPSVNMVLPIEKLDYLNFNFADFDIIHTSGIRPDLFAFLNRKKIKYHITTIHNFVFKDLFFTYCGLVSWVFGNIWLFLWKRADKLVCVSNTMKAYYERWFPSTRLEVIYNGIPITDTTISPDNDVIQMINIFHSKGLKVVGSAAILTKRKGIDQLLNLVAADRDLAAVIIGDGKELSNLIHLSERLNISDRCKFCGFRNNAKVYFRYFDFFIMPSRSEGFGLALIEAVQQKVPVICSDIPVFQELLSSEETTFFKSDIPISLANAMKVAIEGRTKKTDLAFARYQNNYTSEIMAKNYFAIYQSAS